MIIRENYLKKIDPFIDKPIIKVFTGLRRSGKSVLLEQIQDRLIMQGVEPSQIFTLNFESAKAMHIHDSQDLIDEIQNQPFDFSKKVYIFLDEIQEVQNWERAVNTFRVDFDSDIYITGSNSSLLSGELATYLAGRYVEFQIYPFSFLEFTQLLEHTPLKLNQNAAFNLYINLGGMPFLHHLNFDVEPSKQYLKDLYASVVVKDIVSRHNIRDVDLLQRVILFLMSNIGNPFSARSISAYLKNEYRAVAPETVINYIKATLDACLFYPAKRQDLRGKRILQMDEKYYLADHGIRQAVYGENFRDIHLILENIVFMELLRRGFEVTVGRMGEKEVDFVAEKAEQKLYVQVSYIMSDEATFNREISPLLDIKDNFPKYIISMDPINRSTQGIKHVHILTFLLETEDL